MYQTVEAIYDNGKIVPVSGKLNKKKGRVLITFLESEEEQNKSTIKNLLKYKGKIKNLPEEPVKYQREIRDAW